MDVVNFDALKAQGRILDLADVDPNEDYLIIGKYTNKYTTDNFKYTKYPIYAIKAGDVIGVQSVTGLNTDNTDPLNPIVKISVDGTTITGQGTPASPLVAVDPRPYKVFTGVISQTGTSAPTVVYTQENTLGFSLTFSYIAPGLYSIDNVAFTAAKTAAFYQPRLSGSFGYLDPLSSPGFIVVRTLNSANVQANDLFSGTLEIRVYN